MKTHSRFIYFLLSSFSLSSLFAANGTWNIDGASSWNTGGNWSGGIPNGVGESAAFSFNITAARSVTLDGDKTVGELTIGDPTASPTVNHGYTLSAGTQATSRLIFDQTGTADAKLIYPVTATTAVANTISAIIQLNDNLEITSNVVTTANPTQTLSGIITDGASSYGITKKGLGLVTLSGANTYDGSVSIQAGKLTASHNWALGTGAVAVSSGAQLHLSSAAGAYGNALSIAGNGVALTTNETDSANLVGALRYVNSVTSGTLTVQSTGARIGVTTAAGFGIHAGTLSGTGDLQINSSTTNHNGAIAMLGDASAYTGTITLTQGTLRLGTDNLGGSLVVADAGRLVLNNYLANNNSPALGTDTGATRNLTLGSTTGATVFWDPSTTNATSVAGNVNLVGTNTVQLTSALTGGTKTVLSYTGSLTGTAANLTLPGGMSSYRAGTQFSVVAGSPNQIQLTMVSQDLVWTGSTNGNWNITDNNWTGTTFVNGDNVTFNDSPAAASPITVTLTQNVAPNSITVNNPTKNYTLTGSSILTGNASLMKSGAGSLTLSGTTAHTFSGGVTLQSGALYVLSTAGLGSGNTFTMSGGIFASNNTTALAINRNAKISGTVQLGDTTRTGAITFNGIHSFENSTISVFLGASSNFAGQNSLPTELSIATPFSGATNTSCSFSGSNLMSNNLKITTPAAFNSSNIVNLNGTLTDGNASYGLTKEGVGALRLSAANAYDGGTIIKGGTIIAGHPNAFSSGEVTVENTSQAYLVTQGIYPNNFKIAGNGQTLNGLSDLSESGAIHLNASNQILTGTITLTGNSRIAGYFSSANNLISGNIVESGGSWKLDLGTPGSANGTGTLRLTGNNTYSGGTFISKKTVQAFSNTCLGTEEVEISNGFTTNGSTLATRLEVGADIQLANKFFLNHGGRTNSTAATQTWGAITTFPGDATTASNVILTGDVRITKTPANGGHFAVQGLASNVLRVMGAIDSTVPVVLSNGIIELGGGGTAYTELQQWRDTLKLAANDGIATTAILAQGAQAAATFDLNGFNQTIVALSRPTGTNAVSITNNGASPSTLTLAPQNSLVNTYPGTFVTGTSALNLAIGGDAVVALTGNSTAFNGSTTVSGHLRISGTHGSATSTASTQNGSRLSGKGVFGGNVSIGNGTTIDVDPSVAGNLSANGNLTVSGTVSVNLLQVSSNPIVVMSCTGTLTANASNFVLADPGSFPAATFTVVGKQVILTTQTANLTWTGSGGSNWDLNTTSNWTDGTVARTFLNGYNTAFTDAPGSNQSITLASAVAPAAMTFTNGTHSYSFESTTWAIQGGTLTKSGTGRVTFAVPLTLSGGMTINSGSVAYVSPDYGFDTHTYSSGLSGSGTFVAAAGLFNPIVLSSSNPSFSGTLAISRGQVNVTQSNFAGTGSIALGDTDTANSDLLELNLASGVAMQNNVVASSAANAASIKGAGSFAGTASLTKLGSGVLELFTNNSYSGATTIVAGTLRCRALNTISSASTVTLGSAASGVNDTVLELHAGASPDQIVLSSPIVLSAAATSSQAILKKVFGQPVVSNGTVALNGRNLNVKSSGIRLSGVISGTGNLVIDTADSFTPVTLSGTNNDFVGNVSVLSGNVQASSGTAIPDTASVLLGENSVFALSANETINSLTGPASSSLQAGSSALTVGASGSSFAFDGNWQSGTLVKTGAGILTLNGASTSTGFLTVQGGTVLVNQSSAARIDVQSGGTIGGNGAVFFASLPSGGHLPFNGFIEPGNQGVGTFTVNNPLAFSGNSGFKFQIADWNSTTPGTGHDLLVCPKIIFSGSSYVVNLDCTGLTNFSDVEKSFVVVQGNETLFPPGFNVTTFNVTNFPGTGTWRLGKAGVLDNTLRIYYTPAPGYANWATSKGLTSGNNGESQDPDNDGISNLQEYYLAGDPLGGNTGILPKVTVDATHLILEFKRLDMAETDVTNQSIDYGSNLTTWPGVSSVLATAGTTTDAEGVIVTVVENSTNPDDITIKIPRSKEVDGKLFGRLRLIKP